MKAADNFEQVLALFNLNSNKFLRWLILVDKAWIQRKTAEAKRHSKECVSLGKSALTKTTAGRTAYKVIHTV